MAGKITVRELVTLLRYDLKDDDLKKAEAKVAKFKQNLAKIGLAAGAAIVGIGVFAIKAAADMEMMEVQFETLLGSAEKAKDMMKDLTKFAASTPFQLEDLAQGTQVLLSFGVASEDVVNTMRMIGDTAGGNRDKLRRLTLAYGKVQTIGKASMEEIRQMAEAGVPIIGTLTEQLGVTEKEFFKLVSAGKIGRAEITNAFKAMTSEGGIFFKGMERAALTFHGMISTLKDNLKLTAAAIGAELLPIMKELTGMLTELVQGPLGDFIGALVSGLQPVLRVVGKLLSRLFEIFGPLSRVVEQLFAVVSILLDELGTGVLESLMPIIIDLAVILADVLDMLMPLVKILTRLMGLRMRAWLSAMMLKFRLFFAIIRGIVKGLQPLFDALQKVFGPPIQKMLDFFGIKLGSGTELIDRLALAAERFGEGFGRVISNVLLWVFDLKARWKDLLDFFGGIFPFIGRALTAIGRFRAKLRGVFVDVILWIFNLKARWADFAGFMGRIFSGILDAVKTLSSWLVLLFTNPTEAIKMAWEGVLSVFRNVWDWIVDKVSVLVDWISKIPGIDIKIPRLPDAPGAGASTQAQVSGDQNNNTSNLSSDVTVHVDATGAADPEAVGGAVAKAVQAQFAIELRKVFVSTGF